MMNPVGLGGRQLTPLQSVGAELLDYELEFFGRGGMAAARPKKGGSLHGVLHRMTGPEMRRLDEMEGCPWGGYDRIEGRVRLPCGEIVFGTVYCLNDERRQVLAAEAPETLENHPPTERYLQIMIEGCRHYG